mmetsp:Transcript_5001/g.13292  ORF Transcript_5001/g.13292 Transcript_5001/m.13292 type:complete len:294 (-) Transcript_5001:1656-2537(-)
MLWEMIRQSTRCRWRMRPVSTPPDHPTWPRDATCTTSPCTGRNSHRESSISHQSSCRKCTATPWRRHISSCRIRWPGVSWHPTSRSAASRDGTSSTPSILWTSATWARICPTDHSSSTSVSGTPWVNSSRASTRRTMKSSLATIPCWSSRPRTLSLPPTIPTMVTVTLRNGPPASCRRRNATASWSAISWMRSTVQRRGSRIITAPMAPTMKRCGTSSATKATISSRSNANWKASDSTESATWHAYPAFHPVSFAQYWTNMFTSACTNVCTNVNNILYSMPFGTQCNALQKSM